MLFSDVFFDKIRIFSKELFPISGNETPDFSAWDQKKKKKKKKKQPEKVSYTFRNANPDELFIYYQ